MTGVYQTFLKLAEALNGSPITGQLAQDAV
jgi:hypothetical protein